MPAVVAVWVMLAVAAAAPMAMAAAEPVVATGNATAITSTSATLKGTVNPEGQATSYHFEYGTTKSYGSQTATTDAGSGSAGVKASASITSLAPNTAYHYRLVATNASGTTLGSDVSFKTPKPPFPVVTTGHESKVTQTSATLHGTVNPEGEVTTYVFQYGTSRAYGSQTPAAGAGSATRNIAVSATISSLTPHTTYHYRLAATNANGTTYGRDISFTTVSAPAAITIAAVPGTIIFGQATILSGQVLPPRPSHLAVTLQSSGSPGGPWINAASIGAAKAGAYSFSALFPSSNTYYRVLADGATSPTVRVSVRFRVGLKVSRLHPPRGSRVRFHGRVRPAHPGLRVLIQRLERHGHWATIDGTHLRPAGGDLSFYSVRVRIVRSGRYRVLAGPAHHHSAGRSRAVRIHVR